MQKELLSLLANRADNLNPWLIGKIPKHYKRLSVSMEKAGELAKLGATQMAAYFGEKLYFTQAVIMGAMLSGDYDELIIVTCSQYGKSWLMGHASLLLGYRGNPVYVGASTGAGSDIIMGYVIRSTLNATGELQNALLTKKDQLERVVSSLSKTKVAFTNSGFVEAITLADTYQDNVARNQAVGRAGVYIIDEADLVSDETLIETGRRDFARVDKKKYQRVLISNPRNRGYFYEKLTQEYPSDRTFILWMDALTAVEEERWSEDQVLESDFAQNKRTCREYLLCELDDTGYSMFEEPIVYQAPFIDDYTQTFLGVDAAYRGKDDVKVAINVLSEDGKSHIEEIITINKGTWIDGVTADQIVGDVARIARATRAALVAVDVGWGVWLVEGLVKAGVNAKAVNFGSGTTKGRVKANHYAAVYGSNRRAEMHLDLQDLMEKRAIMFAEQPFEEIREVLPYVSTIRKPNGRIDIIPKKEIKEKIGHSPDGFDAVLLSIYAAIVFGGEWTSFS